MMSEVSAGEPPPNGVVGAAAGGFAGKEWMTKVGEHPARPAVEETTTTEHVVTETVQLETDAEGVERVTVTEDVVDRVRITETEEPRSSDAGTPPPKTSSGMLEMTTTTTVSYPDVNGGQPAASSIPPASTDDPSEHQDPPADAEMHGEAGRAAEDAEAEAEAEADDDDDDWESLLSEDDYVDHHTNFGDMYVIFGSKKKAHARARKKHHGTQWECEDCTQVNSILDNPCTACGMLDLDILELGQGEVIKSLRRDAEAERKRNEERSRKEAEERLKKERAAIIAKRKRREVLQADTQSLQNKLEEIKRKLKQKEAARARASDSPTVNSPLTPVGRPMSTSSIPAMPLAPMSLSASPLPPASPVPLVPSTTPTAAVITNTSASPSPRAITVPVHDTSTVITEGPTLPPHLLAARLLQSRDAPSGASTSPAPEGGKRERRRRSDSEGRNRRVERDRDKSRERERRRRSERDEERHRERDHVPPPPAPPAAGAAPAAAGAVGGGAGSTGGSKRRDSDDRRRVASTMEGIKNIISSAAADREISLGRLSGSKRAHSPDGKDSKSRKSETSSKTPSRSSKMRMDMLSPERDRQQFHAAETSERRTRDPSISDKRSRSDSPQPITKRGRGYSKWQQASGGLSTKDRWESEDESKKRTTAGVAVVTCASGKKIFQPKRLAGSESLLKREGELRREDHLKDTDALLGTPTSALPIATSSSPDRWSSPVNKLNGLCDGAEELKPDSSVLTASRGVVYYIATNACRKPWSNPYRDALINATASTTGYGDISTVLHPTFGAECQFATSAERSDASKPAYVAFDFTEWEVIPSQYTVAHSWNYPFNYMRSWSLRASDDNYKWDILSKHTNDESITEGHEVASFKLPPQENPKFYRYFMIRLEGKGNSRGTNQLVCNCFELYGYIRRRKKP